GKTPLNKMLAPGEHKIVVELAGRVPDTRNVIVEKDKTAQVSIELAKAPEPPSRLPGYLVIGGGLALGGAGAYVISLNQDVPTGPMVRYYRDTLAGGIALAASGAVVVGVGVYLLVRHPPRSSAPMVGLAPGGGILGWAGRF